MQDFADRIKLIRNFLNMTREQFSKISGFPEITIRSWEYKKVIPNHSSIEKLIQKLSEVDMPVTWDWLIEGVGISPIVLHSSDFENIKETDFFLSKNPGAILLNIEDCRYEPYFKKGDIVGGIQSTCFDHLSNVIYLDELGEKTIRQVLLSEDERIILTHLNHKYGRPVIFDLNRPKIYKIRILLPYEPSKKLSLEKTADH